MSEFLPAERCWANLDVGALDHNLRTIRRAAGNSSPVAVVKANAYGHGASTMAGLLSELGCHRFAVADAAEGEELRAEGISGTILVLGGFAPQDAIRMAKAQLVPTIEAPWQIPLLEAAARLTRRRIPVTVAVDLGMGRYGCRPREATHLAATVAASGLLTVAGLMGHYPDPTQAESTRASSERFMGVLRRSHELGIHFPMRHVGSSLAIWNHPLAGMTHVRPGAALYGFDPGNLNDLGVALRPVLDVRARILSCRRLHIGEAVSYGSTWRAERPSCIATIGIGYHDGYPIAAGAAGHVLIRGRRAPIRGRVTMDALMVDVTDIPAVEVGDVATIIGRSGREQITLEQLAGWAGTIPYDVCARLSRRLCRIPAGTLVKPDQQRMAA